YANGVLDSRFAENGRHRTCIRPPRQKSQIGLDAKAISLTRSGAMVVAGTATHGRNRTGAFVARVGSRGKSLDRTLAGNRRDRSPIPGVVEVLPEKGSRASFTEVDVLDDGKILASGTIRGKF